MLEKLYSRWVNIISVNYSYTFSVACVLKNIQQLNKIFWNVIYILYLRVKENGGPLCVVSHSDDWEINEISLCLG